MRRARSPRSFTDSDQLFSAEVPLDLLGEEPVVPHVVFVLLGDSDQALINLREAITRNPANLEARVYLAAVLEDDGDREAAEWEAEEAGADRFAGRMLSQPIQTVMLYPI